MERVGSLLLGTVDSYNPCFSELRVPWKLPAPGFQTLLLPFVFNPLSSMDFHSTQLKSMPRNSVQLCMSQIRPNRHNPTPTNDQTLQITSTQCNSNHNPSRRSSMSEDMVAGVLARGTVGIGPW